MRLHEMMMSFAGYEYGGQYKTDDNVILEIDADGNRRVRFRPTPLKLNKSNSVYDIIVYRNMFCLVYRRK